MYIYIQIKKFVHSLIALKFSTDPLKYFLKPIIQNIDISPPDDYKNNQEYSKYWETVIPFGHHSVAVDGFVLYERESQG